MSTEDPRPENTQPEDVSSQQADDDRSIVAVDRVMQLLQKGKILEEHGRLRWSSNYTTIVSLRDDELETLAVYKPQRGERPLWDFPDGTLCYREVAAYRVSQALGWEIVAPTVLRHGSKGLGSVQLYVEHDPQVNYFSLTDDFLPQLQLMAAFDVIINNADRKGGHCLVDPRGKLWGIDHGICFNVDPKLRTVIWDFAGQAIPAQLIQDMQYLLDDLCNRQTHYEQLDELLSDMEIEALIQRLKRLVERKIFPFPSSSGPSYPWPPV